MLRLLPLTVEPSSYYLEIFTFVHFMNLLSTTANWFARTPLQCFLQIDKLLYSVKCSTFNLLHTILAHIFDVHGSIHRYQTQAI